MSTKHERIRCPMCGHSFDPDQHTACASCPLHKGCHLVCCPVCGHSTINPNKSWLVQLTQSLLHPKKNNQKPEEQARLTLACVPPRHRARILNFGSGLSPHRRAQLEAYGLVPGHWVEVVRQSPVTVLQVEHTELALDSDLAQLVNVTEITPADS